MKNLVFILLLLFQSTYAKPAPAPETGKILADWIQLHLQLIRSNKGVSHVAYSRHFSYTSIAFYQVATASEKTNLSLTNQLQEFKVVSKPPVLYNAEAGSNASYAAMLRFFYPANPKAYLIDSLENLYFKKLCTKGKTETVIASATFGKHVSEQVCKWAAYDSKAGVEIKLLETEGTWSKTPPAFSAAAEPQWGSNRLMVQSPDYLKNIPAPVYSKDSTSAFYKMVNDLYQVSLQLSDEQKTIALFWDDSPNGKYISAFGHWSSILAQVINANNIPLTKSAEAFVKMHLALNDAAIVAWQGKYSFQVMRPITYIQRHFQPGWEPLIQTPPHPEFPAAHACLSSAAATALTQVFGENFAFEDCTYDYLNMNCRSFSSFKAAAEEAGYSRLYGGIHYRYSVEESFKLGKSVAENVLQKVKFSDERYARTE